MSVVNLAEVRKWEVEVGLARAKLKLHSQWGQLAKRMGHPTLHNHAQLLSIYSRMLKHASSQLRKARQSPTDERARKSKAFFKNL